ncbi:MAG: cell division protein ZapA [Dysgonomonas sp.]
MTEKKHLTIRLQVCGREFPLRINLDNERIYRDAAVEIDRKVSQYRNNFASADIRKLDETDYAIMTSIQAVSECRDLEIDNKFLEDKIKSLIGELDEYLKR